MKNLTNLFVLIAALALSSCGSSNSTPDIKDTTDPTIEISAPTEGILVDAKVKLMFDSRVTDNIALKSYRLTIKYKAALSTTKSTYDFSFDSDLNKTDAEGKALPTISGKSSPLSFNIKLADSNSKVPKDGFYTLILKVTDTSGNDISKEFDFTIKQ